MSGAIKNDDMEGEIALLAQLRAGNRLAQRHFVERHENDVFYLSLGILGNRQDAEDTMQEVFIKALGAIDRFRGGSSLSTWLYRITVNTCREQQRKRRWKIFSLEGVSAERQELVDEHPGSDPMLSAAGDQLESRLMHSLEHLSHAERQVFALRKFQQLSVLETAQVLGLAEGTVKSLLFRGLQKLRVHLSPNLAPTTDLETSS